MRAGFRLMNACGALAGSPVYNRVDGPLLIRCILHRLAAAHHFQVVQWVARVRDHRLLVNSAILGVTSYSEEVRPARSTSSVAGLLSDVSVAISIH